MCILVILVFLIYKGCYVTEFDRVRIIKITKFNRVRKIERVKKVERSEIKRFYIISFFIMVKTYKKELKSDVALILR